MNCHLRRLVPDRFAGLPLFASIALLGVATLSWTGSSAFGQSPGAQVPGRYIVELRAGGSPAAVARDHGATPDLSFSTAVRGFAGTIPAGRLAALKRDSRVAAVTPDRVVAANPKPSNPGKGGGDSTDDTTPPPREAQVVPEGVIRIGAAPGPNNTQTGLGIGVAIVDTGIDLAHLDLEVGSTSFAAVVKGRKLETSEGPTAGQDDNGHGTHVAGIVAAKDDGFDVVGVAPGATVYAVKVLNSKGSGYDSTVIAGLDWIAKTNAEAPSPLIRVVNMSLGRSGALNDNPTYRAAIQSLVASGISVVVAAGNDAGSEVSKMVPAGYPEVISIASTTARASTTGTTIVSADTASFFTTDGAFDTDTNIGVSISAPGEAEEYIQSSYLYSVGILSAKLGGGTVRNSGTSMAAPHAAGVAALLVEQAGGDITPDNVRLKMMMGASSTTNTPLDSLAQSYTFDGEREGILNAAGALGVILD